jgi:hypothetical protein
MKFSILLFYGHSVIYSKFYSIDKFKRYINSFRI